jgi:type I restriction enzyme S subunit
MLEKLLGPVASGWHYLPLGEVCQRGGGEIQTGPFGSQLHAADYVPIGIPSIMPQNIGDNRIVEADIARITLADAQRLSRYRVRPGDIVYSRRGDVERRALIREHEDGWLCGTGCLRVRVGHGVADPVFAVYYLSHPAVREWIVRHAHGATMPNLNTSILSACPFVLPPLADQLAIASILGALEDKIDLNRRMNKTLETMARAMFKDWFVDFGPTRAKTEGSTPYLAPEIWSLFPDLLDNEGKPQGWRLTVLEEVLSELETGGRPKGGVSGYTFGVPSVGAESIVGLGVFDYSKTKYIPQEYFEGMNKGHIKSRDVLLYKDGGRPGAFEPHLTLFGDGFPFDVCVINEHVYRLRANPDFGQALLYFWLSSDLAMEEMRIKGTGVAIPGLNSTQVKSLATLVPTPNIAKAFDAVADPTITRILANCNEAQSLVRIRDLLLPKLMSGEIRVEDAQNIAEAAK